MRIDAHHHVWDLAIRPQPWTDDLPPIHRSFHLDELRPSLKAHGIDGTVVVQTVAVAEETPELLSLAANDEHVLGVVGWIDLTAAEVEESLSRLQGPKLVGIRHLVQGESDPDWLLRTDVAVGLRAIEAAGLAYDLLITPRQLPAAVQVVQQHPELRFVLDHGAKPLIREGIVEPWAGLITELATSPNVAVKLSGLLTEASDEPTIAELRPYSDHLFTSFGASRVMFGSDWPVCLLRGDYHRMFALAEMACAELSDSERASFFGGTAAAWYHL